MENTHKSPSVYYPLGTDALGRNIFARVIEGGKYTLLFASGAFSVTVICGAGLGLLAVLYTRRFVERIIIGIVDGLLAFPTLVLSLLIIAMMGQGWGAVVIAVGISQMAGVARFTHASALQIMYREYVTASLGSGAGQRWIMYTHILPNIMPTLSAYSIVVFSYSIMNIAALAYLGFSGDISTAEWGTMIAENRQYLRVSPWASVAPGIAITAIIVLLNHLSTRFNRHGS